MMELLAGKPLLYTASEPANVITNAVNGEITVKKYSKKC